MSWIDVSEYQSVEKLFGDLLVATGRGDIVTLENDGQQLAVVAANVGQELLAKRIAGRLLENPAVAQDPAKLEEALQRLKTEEPVDWIRDDGNQNQDSPERIARTDGAV